jgi:hypothetical protein
LEVKQDIGENTFWALVMVSLFASVVIIFTHMTMAMHKTERYGLEQGYCQAQNYGGTGYRWVKCVFVNDPH